MKDTTAAMRHTTTILTLALGLLCSQTATAQAPRTISYQGTLTEATGAPVANGSYTLAFRLYASPDPFAGVPLFSETQTLPVSGGVFNAIIGGATPGGIPPSVAFGIPLYLGISVNGAGELQPRTPLTSSPYALGLALPMALASTANSPLLSITNTGTNSENDAVYGKSAGAHGVHGVSTAGSGVRGDGDIGVVGLSTNPSGGMGVFGGAANGIGVRGDSETGTAVYGASNSGTALHGISGQGFGVQGDSTGGTGVSGYSASGTGVYGTSGNGTGVRGGGGPSGTGVYGATTSGYGVLGESVGNGLGMLGVSVSGAGVAGSSTNYWGVSGRQHQQCRCACAQHHQHRPGRRERERPRGDRHGQDRQHRRGDRRQHLGRRGTRGQVGAR